MRETLEVQTARPHLEKRYFERMAKSMGDKAKLLQFLPPVVEGKPAPRILDVGAGSGDLSNTLSELGYNVTALDASDDAIAHINKNFPNVHTTTRFADQAHELGVEIFDAVICSSILHEVFSYNKTGHYFALKRAMQSFYETLKPNGVLLVRDGVLPENWEEEGTVTLLDGHEISNVELYLKMCPFANGGVNSGLGHLVSLTQVGPKTFKGNVRSLLEFAYTYTWGLDSYPRETQELYAVKTLKEYAEFFEKNGFEVIHTESYLQEGYPVHLATQMTLEVEGKSSAWFDSNAIWIARKS
jgi:2-polyprenyl-3-methyl-5-hydroxy-6-metoxy-1,4-benzoquinol methylase